MINIRPATEDEMAYPRDSFSEGYKQSSRTLRRMPWSFFKQRVRPSLIDALDHANVRVAVTGDTIVGWLAYEPTRRYDVVHWVHVRSSHRSHGVMRQLVNSTIAGHRVVYTFKGQAHEGLAKWLLKNGSPSVVYEPYERWKS